jgi:hypothetical protein
VDDRRGIAPPAYTAAQGTAMVAPAASVRATAFWSGSAATWRHQRQVLL